MLGEPNPVVVVDADGTIVEKVNAVVSTCGTIYELDEQIPEGSAISVGDIQHDGSGVARFRQNTFLFDTPAPDLGQRRAVRLPGDVEPRPDHQLFRPPADHAPDRRRQRYASSR